MKPTQLKEHPQASVAIPTPWVRYRRVGEVLRATFRIPGRPSGINFPEQLEPREKSNAERRADRLWEHTCFEIFVRPRKGPEYAEFNFSPSGECAAYLFNDYRSGMQKAEIEPPAVVPTLTPQRFELSVQIILPEMCAVGLEANFAAVIEMEDGTKSYWALAHPDGPPDFHDPACFIARLPE